MKQVIAYTPTRDGVKSYLFDTLKECCQAYGIKHEAQLMRLIENAGLAPDGRTTFDIPVVEIKKNRGPKPRGPKPR